MVLKTLIENEKSTVSVRKKIKTDLKSVGKTLSIAPCDDKFFGGNHPNAHGEERSTFVPSEIIFGLAFHGVSYRSYIG